MRKFYVALLSLFLLLGWNGKITAQVSAYGVLQSTTTYTPITGGTTVHAAAWDDNQATVALPFTFTFNGTGYNSVVVASNGFITFGATNPGTTNYTPISSATGYAGAVAAMGRDLINNGNPIQWVVDGAAPNRKFIVQWNNARRWQSGIGTVTGDNLNFQIVLNETSNTIQVIYGTCTATNTTTMFAQVGLRGANNSDFNNRTTTTDWTATFPGGANNVTCAMSNTLMPPSGLTFTWLPPTPCVAPLNGGTTVGPSGSFCTGQPFTLAVNSASFGTGLTYQWEFSTDGGSNWSNVATGGTGAMLTTSISTNTIFRRKIMCGASDAYSTNFSVSLAPPIPTPFAENFASYATTFPPSCWSRNDDVLISGQASSAFGLGTGSARFAFYDAPEGTQLDLSTPQFLPVGANWFLTFDHAYQTFLFGEVDELRILYSTDGGATFNTLVSYLGGDTGPLNTAGAGLLAFAPTAAQWASKVVPLPAGTNKLIFRGVSGFGNNLFIDNISITSCVPPSGLNLSAISQTTATLSWTASPSAPASGYQWEVRTSGAPGSPGAVASGTTAAGVTTAPVAGLTANTTYTYYVRSVCAPTDMSSWSNGFTFITPCNPVATPLSENFTSATFPPNCWNISNAVLSYRSTASAYGAGTGSAKFDFYAADPGTVFDLVSPPFTPVPANYRVTFDHAYATFQGENDQLLVQYSTDGGGTYTTLMTYDGGLSGPLNTGGASLPAFTPGPAQWAEKAIALPAGTNRIRFRAVSGYGNNLYLDNILVAETPSCLPVEGLVTATAILPTSIVVNFNPSPSPGVTYIVEVGPVGFTPGTGATAGTGGVITTGTTSPITVNGLTANTSYDVYVRRECITGADYSTNKKTTVTTLCNATNIPYLQNFESAVVPAMPTCTSIQDVNGASGSFWFGTGGGSLETYTDNNPLSWVSSNKSLLYYYDPNDLSRGADDWFYTQGLNLTAGTTYRLKFFYKALDGVNYPEKMEVKYGTQAYAPAMTNTVFTNNNVGSVYDNPFDSVRVDFTPAASGVYYLGFHIMSEGDRFGVLIDDIEVKTAPILDVGISSVTLPSISCPTNGVFVQAKIKNYDLAPLDFSVHPITVNANITGAGTGTLTTTINTGTLEPNATRDVYLNPAFNFSAAGTYNITVTTVSPDDGNTGNDATSTTVNVNPAATVPVITPANATVCLGSSVQLSTQFTGTPPAPVTLPAVSSGTISVTIPDNSPAGLIRTLNVTGIPVGAAITGISVTVNATHTYVSDLAVNLKAPNGKVLNLFNQLGGSGDNLTNTVFSSAATTPITAGTPPFTGTFLPNAAIGFGPTSMLSDAASFADLYSVGNGTWSLGLRDHFNLDVGTLISWSITITYQMLPPAITWTPEAGLYTNAAGTTAYTGTNAPSVFAKPAAAGVYSYTATATSPGGCKATATATVTVSAPPTISIAALPDTVCTSDPVVPLTVTPVGGTWSGTGISGTNFLPSATAVGTYTLTYNYTSELGCAASATTTVAVKDCPERIIRLADNALSLYPNPNTGQFFVRINSVLYNNLTMKVYTNAGVLVRTQQLSGLAWGRVIPIDLTNLPGGTYMVQFYYDGGVRTSEKTFKVIMATP